MLKLIGSKKLLNFWKISSDCVQDDHYELDNLIADDEAKRNIGFMAFPVSKPPIFIQLECKYKINLKMLEVFSALSSLKSTRFHILVEVSENERKFFRKIEDIWLDDQYQGFCLKTSDCEYSNDALKIVNIHPRFHRILSKTNVIKIIISDTRMRRSPVIRKIEIYGEPSTANSKEENEEILRLNKTEEDQLKTEEAISDDEKNIQSDFEEEFKIPEEFQDAITHELLSLPYILPSGAVVDESTLEKHKRSEESHGRFPNDPFTGVYFTADSQPKFDAALKMRLDDFKLKNSNEIEVKSSGRSIGRAQPSTSTAHSLGGHISKKIKLSGESQSLDDIIKSIYKNKQITTFTKPTTSTVTSKNVCCQCRTTLNLYKINSCKHVFCKNCLNLVNSICCECEIKFENKNVEKFHS